MTEYKTIVGENAIITYLRAENARLVSENAFLVLGGINARNTALDEAIEAVGLIPCDIGQTKHYWAAQDAIRAVKGCTK